MTDFLLDSAREDFREARRQAALQQVLASFKGESAELLPFDSVRRHLTAADSSELGLQEIPLDAIVGSVSRHQDFTRKFLPRSDDTEDRWTKVKLHINQHGLTPIRVYQVGDAYFVIDGNHRVSIAHQMGSTTIPAYVTQVEARVPISPEDDPVEILIKVQYSEFLQKTNLDQLRPEADLMMTKGDHYEVLLDQIEAKRFLLSFNVRSGDISFEAALIAWYDRVYTPMVQLIRKQGLARYFPTFTEADLYVLVLQHREKLRELYGWNLDTVAVASDLAQHEGRVPGHVLGRVGEQIMQAMTPESFEGGPAPGAWREERLERRPQESLFSEILISGTGIEEDRNVIKHASLIAERENGRLFFLSIIPSGINKLQKSIQQARQNFAQLCMELGVRAEIAFDDGQLVTSTLERAAWADLLVMSLADQNGGKPSSEYGQTLKRILQRSPRPVLLIPEQANSTLDRALLAFDGSRKADEALFLSAYLASNWPLTLTVVAAGEKRAEKALDRAYSYLKHRNVEATYIKGKRPAANLIQETVGSQKTNLIIMGGFGHRPALEIVIGSTVNQVIQNSQQPILICR